MRLLINRDSHIYSGKKNGNKYHSRTKNIIPGKQKNIQKKKLQETQNKTSQLIDSYNQNEKMREENRQLHEKIRSLYIYCIFELCIYCIFELYIGSL